jgi:hypothetical protein
MNNEPVAWIVRTFDADKGKTVEAIWDFKPMNTIGCTPLYTHPAKTLTDEEIEQEWVKSCPDKFHTNLIGFARAILKKASEK